MSPTIQFQPAWSCVALVETVEGMDICPDCGQPLERADDFWYCDNPVCPGNGRPRRPTPEDPEPPIASEEEGAGHLRR